MTEQTRPVPPLSGIIYGEITYWGTILGAIIAIVGSVIAFLSIANVMDPAYVFSSIWEGKSNVEIWQGGCGAMPNGHWYLSRLGCGDALTMFGVAFGIFTVIPGMLASAIILLKEKEYVYGGMAFLGAMIIIGSFAGMVSLQ